MYKILIENGVIIPVDGQSRAITGKALLVEGNRIAAIAEADSLKADHVIDRVIDAAGQAVMPGFVNAHTHTPLQAMMRGIVEDKEEVYFSLFMPIENGIVTEDDCDAFARLSCLEMLKYGTTCLNDLEDPAHSTARALLETGMRGVLGPEISDLDPLSIVEGDLRFDSARAQRKIDHALDAFERWHGIENDRIRVRFANEGPMACSPEVLRETRRLARERNTGINIHANAYPLETDVLKLAGHPASLEYLDSLGDYLDEDVAVVHFIYNTEKEVEILQASGAWMVHCGLQQAKHSAFANMGDYYRRGLKIALGSDAYNNDPFEQMRFALVLARVQSGERMLNKAHDYLEMHTIKAARAIGMDDLVGSLEVGKRADIILVDYQQPHIAPMTDYHDLVTSLVYSAHGKDVTTVIVDGHLIIENGSALHLDQDEMIEAANRRVVRVHDELGKFNEARKSA